jgi:hypothetical protein
MKSRSGGHATVIGGSPVKAVDEAHASQAMSWRFSVQARHVLSRRRPGPHKRAGEVRKCGEDHGTALVLSP